MKNPVVTIFGASGCGNVGDDLIGVTLQALLERDLSSIGATVRLAGQHQREMIEDSDAVVIGGGGLIYHDGDNLDNVFNYTDIILRAYEQSIPVYTTGIGAQNVTSPEARELYERALPLVRMHAVRNEEDAAIFTDLGVPAGNIIHARDLVFLSAGLLNMDTNPKNAPDADGKKLLVLSPASWQVGAIETDGKKQAKEAYQTYLRKNLPPLAERFRLRFVCHASEDRGLYQEFAAMPGVEMVTFEDIDDSRRLFDVYKDADLVITGRYHGLIAAIMTGRPVIDVSFKSKNTHKQQKLIEDSFPSLSRQLYQTADFIEQDVLGTLEDNLAAAFGPAAKHEVDRAVRLAGRNSIVSKHIAGYLT